MTGLRTIDWRQVVAGDELKSVNNGRFYPVASTAMPDGGKVRIGVRLPDRSVKQIVRPTPAEPTATVRRGPDGTAVDVFIEVFRSGGEP